MTDVKKSIKKKNYASALIHLMALPIEWLIGEMNILKAKHRKMFVFLFGVIILLGGAFLASIHQEWMPHWVWDAISYGIHGMGLAPIAKIIFDVIEIEI